MSPDDHEPTAGDGAGDAAADALAHLQAAAIELISAGRSFLEAADRAVRDDESVARVVDTLSGLGRDVMGRAAGSDEPDQPDEPEDGDGYQGIDIDG